MNPRPLAFGVYPLGIAGGPDGLVSGPPDDFDRIGQALQELAGDGPPLVVRMYVVYEGSAEPALDLVDRIAGIGGVVDLSLNFHDRDGDVEGWCSFVDQVVRRHGSRLGSIGVTNEANLLDVPFAPDGAYPRAFEALVEGVRVAAAARAATGATAALGFTTASETDATADAFWQRLAEHGGAAVGTAVDFAGLTLYPGGFGGPALPAGELSRRTAEALAAFRGQLSTAGIPESVPIRVCECGWPTGPGRTEQQQAEALGTVVETVASLRESLGITHWELFTLRDAASDRDDPFCRFGVLRDDYTPKAAYHALREWIRRYGI